MFYIILALIAGVNIIISTSINASLGKRIGLLNNAIVFYTIAVITSAIAFIIFSTGEPFRTGQIVKAPYLAYIGSLIPIATLFLSTYNMQKFSVVNYVLITYIAEIFTAAVLDYIIAGTIHISKIIGVMCMIAGIYLDNKIINSNNNDFFDSHKHNEMPGIKNK